MPPFGAFPVVANGLSRAGWMAWLIPANTATAINTTAAIPTIQPKGPLMLSACGNPLTGTRIAVPRISITRISHGNPPSVPDVLGRFSSELWPTRIVSYSNGRHLTATRLSASDPACGDVSPNPRGQARGFYDARGRSLASAECCSPSINGA